MVDNHHKQERPSLQVKNMTPPARASLDKEQRYSQMNTIPLMDEYKVENTQDKFDRDNQYVQVMKDYDDTSEALIRAFVHQNVQDLEVEVQQET